MWLELLSISWAVFFFNLAMDSHASHWVRVAGISLAIVLPACVLRSDRTRAEEMGSKWISGVIFAAILLHGVYRILSHW